MNRLGMMVWGTLVLATCGCGAGHARDVPGDPLPSGAVQRLGTSRMRYAKIGGFQYLGDNRAVVAAGSRLDFLDLEKGVCLATHEIPGALLLTPVCDTNQQLLAVADGSNNAVVVWDLAGQRVSRQWRTGQSNLVNLCLSPDKTRVLTTGRIPPTLKEWDLADGRQCVSIVGPIDGFSMAVYGPGGKTAFVGDVAQSSLLHYDLATGAVLTRWNSDIYTYTLALSADGKRLLVGSRHRATEWRIEDYAELQQYSGHYGHQATSVAYCPDPDEILTGARDGSIRRWNRPDAQVLLRWIPHPVGRRGSHVETIQVSPDGRWVLSFGGELLTESDIRTGRPRLGWARHNGAVRGGVFDRAGRVTSVATDGSVRLWDPTSGHSLYATHVPSPLGAHALAVSPDGSRCAVGGYSTIWEREAPTGTVVRTLSMTYGSMRSLGFARTLLYTPDGSRLVGAGDNGTIYVWAADSKEPAARLIGHRGGVLCLAVSSDGKRLLSGGRDCTMRLWNLDGGTLLNTMEGHRGWVESVRFVGAGEEALSAGRDGCVRRWNLRTRSVRGEMRHGSWVHALAAAPDGQAVFSGADDGTIVVWDLPHGSKQQVLAGHGGPVRTLALSADGNRLLSGADDTTLLVWDIRGAERRNP